MKTANPDKLGLSKDKLMAMENFFKEKYIKNGKHRAKKSKSDSDSHVRGFWHKMKIIKR